MQTGVSTEKKETVNQSHKCGLQLKSVKEDQKPEPAHTVRNEVWGGKEATNDIV